MAKHVMELWANPNISMDLKKAIMNINIGCLDKRYNKVNQAEYLTNKKEACAKQKTLPNSRLVTMGKANEDSDEQPLYLVVNSVQQELDEGFLPISFLKYDLQRLELFKMYRTLKNEGFSIKGINTDAIFVAHEEGPKLEERTKKKQHS
jgi:hypothetical protein